jgi:hypothetical protein
MCTIIEKYKRHIDSSNKSFLVVWNFQTMNILKTYKLFKLEFSRKIHMIGTYLKKYYILCKTNKWYKPVKPKKKHDIRLHKWASQQGWRRVKVRLPFLAFVCFGLQWLTPHPCLSFPAALGKRDNMVGVAIESRDHISGRVPPKKIGSPYEISYKQTTSKLRKGRRQGATTIANDKWK